MNRAEKRVNPEEVKKGSRATMRAVRQIVSYQVSKVNYPGGQHNSSAARRQGAGELPRVTALSPGRGAHHGTAHHGTVHHGNRSPGDLGQLAVEVADRLGRQPGAAQVHRRPLGGQRHGVPRAGSAHAVLQQGERQPVREQDVPVDGGRAVI